nr:hypothetical protein Itr_chr07CG11050 [Ipomoea trifida]
MKSGDTDRLIEKIGKCNQNNFTDHPRVLFPVSRPRLSDESVHQSSVSPSMLLELPSGKISLSVRLGADQETEATGIIMLLQ